ncbi:MAG: phospho-sugar mutase [Treponemataceae bacterium]
MDTNEILARANAYIAEEQDENFKKEVEQLVAKKDMVELEDRFFQDLEFGTAGLRGIIGGGTNRMNPLVVNKATQGLANYFIKTFPEKAKEGKLSAVIAYDSRNFSDVFAEAAALIFAANGFKTYLFSALRPTPELSFAIRHLGCDTGIVVTASHNPPQYNGYKAYWNDGAQVIEPHDTGIINEVNAVKEVKTINRLEAVATGKLIVIDKEIDEKYWDYCKGLLFRPDLMKEKACEAKIVYTPLHGTGAMHIEKVLSDLGLTVITVPEQREPDGSFHTVEKPNPEEKSAMKMAVELGEKEKADVVMATDPDADRFGVAVPDSSGNYVLVSGNQMGVLLADYIITTRKELNKMPKNPAIVRSIVTSTFTDKICAKNGVELVECLTGFKWIANCMNEFEKTGKTYIFGFEESYGYNVGTCVHDKDGVSAGAMCAEMTLYWRTKGKSLLQRIEELYKEYGHFQDGSVSLNFPGSSGGAKMKSIMTKLREEGIKELGGKKVLKIRDIGEGYIFSPFESDKKEKINFPKSNVIQFFLEGGSIVSARPSGTEPKIKFYINISIEDSSDLKKAKAEADNLIATIDKELKAFVE